MDYPNGIPECGTDALRFALLAYDGCKHLCSWMATITKRGKAWRVRVFIGRDAEGKQRFATRTVHGTKAEAEAVVGRPSSRWEPGPQAGRSN